MLTILTLRYRRVISIALLIVLVGVMVHPFLDVHYGRVSRGRSLVHFSITILPAPQLQATVTDLVQRYSLAAYVSSAPQFFSPLLC